MSAAEALLRAAAATLPPHVRARYREEWLADLAGADALGLTPSTVVAGAIATAAAIDRADPLVTGMPRAALAVRRGRWAGVFLGSGIVLGLGGFLLGGSLALRGAGLHAGLGTGLQLVALASAAVGVLLLASALVAASAGTGTRGLAIGLGVVVGGALLIALAALIPILGVLAIAAGAAALVVLLALGRDAAVRPPSLARGRRVLVALPFSAAVLAVGGLGLAHILVWNPMAKLPGMTLDEIYTGMAAAGEGTGAAFIAAWVACWAGAAVALPVLVALPAADGRVGARGIATAGLLAVGATAAGQWFAGFGMGMGIADAFATTGGDAAPTGPALALVGQLALVAALAVGLPPRRIREPAAAS